jgi:peroxiredoxin
MRQQMVKIDSLASDFRLSTLSRSIKLSDYRGRQNVLLYFMCDFASARCWQAALHLGQLRELFHAHHTAVLLIGGRAYLEPATRLAIQLGLPFPLLSDADGAVARQYGLAAAGEGFTATVLIDKQGFVRYRRIAVLPQTAVNSTELRTMVRSLAVNHPYPWGLNRSGRTPCC